ncbi:MAG: O-antigen ligase family protein [bacterium]
MKIRSKFASIILVILFLFLPFSSWLVSYFKNNNISLLRDGLVLLIICLAIPNFFDMIKRKKIYTASTLTTILFILYGLVSYFWREASVEQWLRGFRFTFLPIVMFLSIYSFEFDPKQRLSILRSVLISGVAVIIIGILEYFHIRLPLGEGQSNLGAIQEFQYIESTNILRLQSVLAGPNAFALYLLALISYIVGSFKEINQKLIYLTIPAIILLVLTFSRSVLFGLIALIAGYCCIFIFKKFNKQKAWLIIILSFSLSIAIGLSIYSNYREQPLVTHNTSTNLRTIQYERIWETRNEIGLWGRGLGTAGPASQYRLDGGENHWTENIYFDIFEDLGLIGLLIYIALLTTIILSLIKGSVQKNLTAFLAIISFIVAGFFINNYTGQAGIFLVWLAAGMARAKTE